MKIVLFTTRLDKGRWAIEKEAKKVSLSCQVFFYKDLVYKNGKIFVSSLGPLVIGKGDRVILRDPYNAGGDYSFFARKLLKKYYENILLDRECYSGFPFYEDKLFQADLFVRLGIATPETFFGRRINRLLEFPVIAKPRVGSRGRGVRIFDSRKEIRRFFARKSFSDYIVQKYYKTKNEYRIILLRHKTIGVVDERVHLKDRGRVGVTIRGVAGDLPERIWRDAVKITRAIKADFAGIDVVYTSGGYYFLEVNLSPQFGAFAKTTGINVAGKIASLARS